MAIKFTDENLILTKQDRSAILVGLTSKNIELEMEELVNLTETAGIIVLGVVTQTRDKVDSAYHIGKGKVEELAQMCQNMEADLVIFNDELTGVKIRNLEEILNCTVIDRSILILEIFAGRALSDEGRLQVELAQLEYRLPRLTGFGKALSRLGGGIGTRGPGEKQLETDRRHIRLRIKEIEKDLLKQKKSRETRKSRRQKSQTPKVSLIGYTNTGKSALLNYFLEMSERNEKTVLEKDQLFSTLDTSHRKIILDDNKELIISDTVGFVSNLPHGLIKAFRATLEELSDADLILNVIDVSDPMHELKLEVTNNVLQEIGIADRPEIVVYNKIDKVEDKEFENTDTTCYVSAKTGEGMDELLQMIRDVVFNERPATMYLPYEEQNILNELMKTHKEIKIDCDENGTIIELNLTENEMNRYMEFVK